MTAFPRSLANEPRFPGATLDEDRSARRAARHSRMLAAHKRIAAALSDLAEAAWDEITHEDYEYLCDHHCRQAEARAAAVEAALVGLTNPPPSVSAARRRASS